MKDLMLIAIGVGAGFAICGCFLFYIMATIKKNDPVNRKYNDETLRLMDERNELDRRKAVALEAIFNSMQGKRRK